MALNFNTNPYYDDFDEDKNFQRILFRPGRAVQARELTQSQTILQNQIDRFGKHIFKEGSRVTGGESFDENVLYVKLQPNYSGNTINISGYDGYFAVSANSNAVFKIKKTEIATTTDPNTLFLTFIKGTSQISGNVNVAVSGSETLRIYSTGDLSSSNLVANVISVSTESANTGRIFSVNDGVFFTNGCFVKNQKQTVVVSKYSNNANVTVGFDVTESIVTSTSDTSLLDPAIGASNYIAPGSDRYKIELTLTAKEIETNESVSNLTSSKYIELARYRKGELVRQYQSSEYAALGDALARRTFDESGNYKVRGLDPRVPDEKFSANSTFTFEISPGKAYVKGYEIETIGKNELELFKSRDTESVSGYDVPAYYGNYFYVTTANGAVLNLSTAEKLELHRNNGAFSASTKLAEAYPRNIEYVSGNGSSAVYKLQLFNIIKTSSVPLDLTNCIIAGSSTSHSATYNVHSSSTITRSIAGTFDAANPLINLTSTSGVTIGMEVVGTGIKFPTFVTAIDGNQVTINQTPATSNTLQTLTFRSRYLSDTNYDTSVFEASYDVVKQFSQVNYYAKRVFKSVSFSAGVASVQTNDGTERFANVSGANLQKHYAICIRTGGTGSFPNRTWVDLSGGTYISVPTPSVSSPATLDIDLGDATFNGTADVLTTLDITAATRRTKTLAQDQIKYFAGMDTANSKSLGYADVVNVKAVYIASGGNAASNANVNVIGSFTFDNGGKEGFYDHSTIKVKPGSSVNTGNTMVIYDRYDHSGTGFFDTLSYPTYTTIPTLTKTNGDVIDLRDSIDFRPIRTANTTSNIYSNVSMSFDSQQIVDSLIGSVDTDIEYYLRRNDKIVLYKNGEFKTLTGISALRNPPIPNDEEDSMTLFTLSMDPYTYNTSNVKIKIENNRRYTMKDIGSIDNRLTRVEYYTALNLLEKDIASTIYYDEQDNQLFNNGFVVDSFKGHNIGDVFNTDYKCSIDYDDEILRPRFESNGTSLSISTSSLSTTGNLLTLSYTSVPYITQNLASETVNVNPFNVVGFIGYVRLETSAASWVNFSTRPDVVINNDNSLDNFVYSENFTGTKWNDWVLLGFSEETGVIYTYYSTSGKKIQRTSDGRVRAGDSAIIESKLLVYTANTEVNFELLGMRPNTELNVYLDLVNVSAYMRNYNTISASFTTEPVVSDENGYAKGRLIIPNDDYYKFTVGKNHLYFCDDKFDMKTASTLAETYFYTANPPKPVVIPDPVRPDPPTPVVTPDPVVPNPKPPTPKPPIKPTTPSTPVTPKPVDPKPPIEPAEVKFYLDSKEPTHSLTSGIAINAVSNSPSGRLGESKDYQSAIRDATGESFAYISSETASSNLQTVRSTPRGNMSGVDYVDFLYRKVLGRAPDFNGMNYWLCLVAYGVSLEYIGKAFADGAKNGTDGADKNNAIRNCPKADPIAQTFFVNKYTNPDGIFVSSIDIYFASKDNSGIPVTLELRPTVNGYPHSERVFTGSEVTLNPSSVNIPPNLNDPVPTTFTFRTPIFLEPGEYSFVIKANSDEYTVYIATIGQQRLNGLGPIVSQPYIGSFFKSQNASTWTPEQNSDICFVLRQCRFSANTVQTAILNPKAFGYDQTYDISRLNIPYDILSSSANTSFELATKVNSSGTLGNYISVIPNSNIIFDQRKLLNASSDANVRIRMITLNPDVSPYVDASRCSYTVVKNLVDSPTAAEVVANPETQPSNGGALSKYIMRKVTLNDGFDATSLRVYLQQNLPQGSSIQVYYRVQSAIDTTTSIEQSLWTLMYQTAVSSTNQNPYEYYDYEYKADAISYTSGDVNYTNFRTFAIKIVLHSTNPSNAPSAKNLRVIALS